MSKLLQEVPWSYFQSNISFGPHLQTTIKKFNIENPENWWMRTCPTSCLYWWAVFLNDQIFLNCISKSIFPFICILSTGPSDNSLIGTSMIELNAELVKIMKPRISSFTTHYNRISLQIILYKIRSELSLT